MADQTLKARADTLELLVGSRVTRLQHEFLAGGMTASATLAHLRQAAGREVGSVPEVWEFTIAGLDSVDPAVDDDPTSAERAAHAALGLYAQHQRGMRGTAAHQLGRRTGGIGAALARLGAPGGDSADPVTRRFTVLITSSTFAELTYHLRALVGHWLAGAGVSLDYGRLARDLYLLQVPAAAPGVQLTWAREFYRTEPTSPTGLSGADDPTDSDDGEMRTDR